MKRIVFLFFYLFTFLPLTIDAAPAWPFPFQVKQPDGTMLTILLHGDEHFNWVTTADDGVLLVSKDNGYYVADIDARGELTATTLLAHDPIKRTTTELTAIERQAPRRAQFIEQGTARMELARRAQPIDTIGGYFPHEGSPRVLVILAEYSDTPFTLPQPQVSFDQYLNGKTQTDLGNREDLNVCSVTEYFRTVSDGQFLPLFDIYGPVILPHELAYYGGTNSNGTDEKMTEFCQDAINSVLESYPDLDLSLYDNVGNDNKIEMVYVIHSGFGQNTRGPANTMWAKVSPLNISVNDYTISYGGCQSELFMNDDFYESGAKWINGIGPFIHEFSHGMGLPDIYSNSNAKYTINQHMQSWDVMDYGIYNNSGYAPAAYTAWEQEAMGWLTIVPLDEAETGISLTPIIEGGTAYKIQNPDKENEFIVFENIQKSGINKSARGHGLLAYHIDYAYSIVNMGDNPNNTSGHPRVAVIPSGGLSFSTDLVTTNGTYTDSLWHATHRATPFPGTKNVTTLTDEQALPNFCFYSGDTKNPVGHSLYNIKEENGVITFDYDEDSATGIGSLTPALSQEEGAWYTLDGRRLSGEPKQKGIFIYQGKKVVK